MIKASTQYIRDINTSNILRNIYFNNPITRKEIARKTKLNKSTISRIINDLLEKGLVVELGNEEKNDVGRKSKLIKTNENAGYCIGMEIDDTKITSILTNLKGNIIYSTTNDIINPEQEIIVYQIIEIIKDLFSICPESLYGIVGIGIGIQGMVSEAGIIHFAPYLKWHNFDLKRIIENHFNCHVELNNEANYSIIGEQFFHLKNANMVMLSIKTGVGMGIIINHKLYNGKLGYAGEIGHMIIDPNGRVCPCGNQGCFEQYASEKSFLIDIKEKKLPYDEAVENIIKYLSIGINNILTIFNPEVVVLNSNEFQRIPNFIHRLEKRLNSTMNTHYRVIFSNLSNQACVLGAVSSVIMNFYGIQL